MKIVVFCLCWVLIGATPSVMAQQTVPPHQSWDVLRQLQVGEKIQVDRKTVKKKLSGKFLSLSDVELAIERKGKVESISRDEVKNIWRVKPPSRTKRAIEHGEGSFMDRLPPVPQEAESGRPRSMPPLRFRGCSNLERSCSRR